MLTAGVVVVLTFLVLIALESSHVHCKVCMRPFAVFPYQRCWTHWREVRIAVRREREARRAIYRRRGS